MADFPTTIFPSSPVEVETRKAVAPSESETGVRDFVIRSDAYRFYNLKFDKREIDEVNTIRELWELVYPSSLLWTNAECDANADEFEIDSAFQWHADDNNVCRYQLALKGKDPRVHPAPPNNILWFDPSYAWDAETGKLINVSESESFSRMAAATSGTKNHYGLAFTERTLIETLLAEGFWNYHYPGRVVSFTDTQLSLTENYLIDSNFKWTIHDWDWITYSFVIHQV